MTYEKNIFDYIEILCRNIKRLNIYWNFVVVLKAMHICVVLVSNNRGLFRTLSSICDGTFRDKS